MSAPALVNPGATLDQWNMLVALGAPFIIAFINQPGFKSWLRVVVVSAVCVGASLITTSLNGGLTLKLWLHSLIIVLVGAVGLYHTVFRSLAPKVETATSKPAAAA